MLIPKRRLRISNSSRRIRVRRVPISLSMQSRGASNAPANRKAAFSSSIFFDGLNTTWPSSCAKFNLWRSPGQPFRLTTAAAFALPWVSITNAEIPSKFSGPSISRTWTKWSSSIAVKSATGSTPSFHSSRNDSAAFSASASCCTS